MIPPFPRLSACAVLAAARLALPAALPLGAPAAAGPSAMTEEPAQANPPASRSAPAPPLHLDRPGPVPTSPSGAPATATHMRYPLYQWPLDRALGDGLVLVNYVDHDSTAAVLDYEGGTHSYDGHRGIDYTLYNFRLMDRGCPVLAAAPGTVAYIGGASPGAFDRSCSFSTWPDDGNWIWIDNGDGTFSQYYHLRAWSLTVGIGESIQAGQLLGLVGSSGYSTAPHLHFETGDYFSGEYAERDPYTGPYNPLPSLWHAQEDYQGDDPLRFVDMGIYSDDAVGGSVFNTTYCDTQEGIHAPAVFGIHEPHLDLWVQFQGNAADGFRIEVRRPDGSEWASFEDVLAYDAQFNWFWAYWFWDGWVGEGDYGSWTVRAIANGTLSREVHFEVGPVTIYAPRLRPAGRSFRVDGTAQADTLRLTPLSPAAAFTLVGAPPEVSLVDSILTVGPTSSQATRSAFFQVVAVDGAARSDTAWFHLVDMSKPLEPSAAVEQPVITSDRLGLRVWPNPTRAAAGLEFRLKERADVEFVIYDAAGRRVRGLPAASRPAGEQRSSWDGRDDAGRLVPAGAYFARIAAGTRQEGAAIMIVR